MKRGQLALKKEKECKIRKQFMIMAEQLISAFTLYADIKNQSSYALTHRTKTKGKIC